MGTDVGEEFVLPCVVELRYDARVRFVPLDRSLGGAPFGMSPDDHGVAFSSPTVDPTS